MSGNSTTTTKADDSSTTPWAPQQGYLLGAFSDANNLYNQSMATGPYTGNYVAAPTQDQYDQYGNLINYANGAGAGTVSSLANNGASMYGAGAGGVDGALSNLTTQASTDPTANAISDAQKYEPGFDIPGSVQAAMQSANTEAADSTLPNLYRGADATGNINSDRTAIADGVVRGQLANTAAGLSAQMQNNTYQAGGQFGPPGQCSTATGG